MNNNMEIELMSLRSFIAVVQEGTITAAAEKLHITQSALSKRLNQLETECNAQLLIRGSRKVNMTSEGELLLQYSVRIVKLCDELGDTFADLEKVVKDEIRIGMGNTKAMKIVTRAFMQLKNKYPMCSLYVKNLGGNDICRELKDNKITFGILTGIFDSGEFDYIKLPITYKWGLIMKSEDAKKYKDGIKYDEFATLPLICSVLNSAKDLLYGFTGIEYDSLNIVATYNLINNVPSMVEEGLGVAFASDIAEKVIDGRKLEFVPLKPEIIDTSWLVWSRHRQLTKGEQIFVNEMRNVLQDITK